MALSDVTAAGVNRALDEFDRIGRIAFLARYGFREAREYMLVRGDSLYDSKAIAGVAHGFSGKGLKPLAADGFTGGLGTVVPRLRALGFEVVSIREGEELPAGNETPGRTPTFLDRVVRSSVVAEAVKRLHGHACQVCGVALSTPSGVYAEAAHIQPVGAPHHGPDVPGNILCLCPNHHVLFDAYAFSINDDGSLIGATGKVTRHRRHELRPESLRHHREHHARVRAT